MRPQSSERSTYELQAYANHGVSVDLVCKAGKEEGETFVRAEVRNENDRDVENLELQMIVPKYMQMQQKPLSSDVVPSSNGGVCTQLFRLRNNSDGEKETVVRLRIMFQLGQEKVNEMVQVSGFDDDACGCLFYSWMCRVVLSSSSTNKQSIIRYSHLDLHTLLLSTLLRYCLGLLSLHSTDSLGLSSRSHQNEYNYHNN